MNSYIAKLVFNIDINDGSHNSQFDEQWRLLFANSADEAFTKATHLGYKEEESFLNKKLNQIKWNLIGIPEVHLVDKLEDGVEILSSIHQNDDANNYISFVKKKSENLLLKLKEQNFKNQTSA